LLIFQPYKRAFLEIYILFPTPKKCYFRIFKAWHHKSGVEVHTYNPSTQEAKARGYRIPEQPGL
jgi:hypothetical protein